MQKKGDDIFHVKYDKKINGVRVVSNPKGYPSEHTKFDDTFTIHV